MKKRTLLILIVLSVFIISANAQTTVSHGMAMGVTLSKDFEKTNDYGNVPKENVFQSFRFGYSAEITQAITDEWYFGGTAMATLGGNFRALPKVGETEYDEHGNEIEKASGLDGFFANLLEANLKIAPLFGYSLQPYRLPQYYTFALAPVTVATDFGLSAGDKKSASIYLGTGFELGYYWTKGNQKTHNGVILALDYKWNQLENIGAGFQTKKDFWGLDITISARKALDI